MYFNDVNIGFYIVFIILGLLVGEFVNWANKRLSENKAIFTKGSFKEYKKQFSPNYILMILTAIIYIALLYKFGIGDNFVSNLDLIKYVILTPMLLCTFIIDYKLQIIPNRLVLTMFEIGLIFTFLYGLSNIAISINMLLGMVVGGGIFLGITLLGGLAYGKEAMGLGDVKFMGALGLYFGWTNIIIISIVSFLIAAILSIIFLITKIKKVDEYMAFGPFIVLATILTIFVPYDVITNILLNIFTLGLYSKNMS